MLGKYAGLCARILRPAFFACITMLVALSWLPGDEVVRTGVSGRGEHVIAYFGTAVIMALAYRERLGLRIQALLLVVLAGILEVGQLFAPGRTPAILDFAASSAGAVLGGLAMVSIRPRALAWLGLDRLPDEDRS